MTKHHPGGGGLIGKTDIKADDTAGQHGPQAKTDIHFPVGKKFGQAILIGNPTALNKTDKLHQSLCRNRSQETSPIGFQLSV